MMKFWGLFRKKASGNIAKDRLKVVLVSDRAACSPTVLENIREDLRRVLARYVEVDTDHIDIEILQTKEARDAFPALVARVPFKIGSKTSKTGLSKVT